MWGTVQSIVSGSVLHRDVEGTRLLLNTWNYIKSSVDWLQGAWRRAVYNVAVGSLARSSHIM